MYFVPVAFLVKSSLLLQNYLTIATTVLKRPLIVRSKLSTLITLTCS